MPRLLPATEAALAGGHTEIKGHILPRCRPRDLLLALPGEDYGDLRHLQLPTASVRLQSLPCAKDVVV